MAVSTHPAARSQRIDQRRHWRRPPPPAALCLPTQARLPLTLIAAAAPQPLPSSTPRTRW